MRELAILLVAARWDSAFERDSHEAIARALGFGDDELAAIRAQDVTAFADDDRTVGSTVIALLDGDLTTTHGMRHPPLSASTASSSSPPSSGTTRPSPCSCGCSVSGEIARVDNRRYGFTL